jgi:hypothetical protein
MAERRHVFYLSATIDPDPIKIEQRDQKLHDLDIIDPDRAARLDEEIDEAHRVAVARTEARQALIDEMERTHPRTPRVLKIAHHSGGTRRRVLKTGRPTGC